MNKRCVLLLMVFLMTSLGLAPPALAQQLPTIDMPAADDPASTTDTPGDVLNGCQDSLLLEPFPMLRMLIDLLTQLLDLLERADQQLSDQNATDPPTTDPTAIEPSVIDPAAIDPTQIPSGGFGVGPVPSVQ